MKEAKVVRYRTDEGVVVGVAVEGRTRVRLVVIGVPVAVKNLPIEETRYMMPVENPALGKAARGIRGAGRRLGITKGARKLLKGL